MNIIYLPISQYTLNELKDGSKCSIFIWTILSYLDRFPNENVDTLNDMFDEEILTEFLSFMSNVDMLHTVLVEGEPHIVISEYMDGNSYTPVEINGKAVWLKYHTKYPEGLIEYVDFHKLRDVAYDYESLKPQRGLIEELLEQVSILTKKVKESIKQCSEKIFIEHELHKLQAQVQSQQQIENVYGTFNIMDMLTKINLVVTALCLHSDNKDMRVIGDTINETMALDITPPPNPKDIETKEIDKLSVLLEKTSRDTLEKNNDVIEDEEENDDEEDDKPTYNEDDEKEDEVRLVDILEGMTREELITYIKKMGYVMDMPVSWRALDTDGLIDAILEITAPDVPDEEKEDTEKVYGDTFEDDAEVISNDDDSLVADLGTSNIDKEMEQAIRDNMETRVIAPPATHLLNEGHEYKERVEGLITKMTIENPSLRFPQGKKIVIKACATLGAIATTDGADMDELFDALEWATTDKFWRSNFVSIAALRKTSRTNGNKKWENIQNAYIVALDKETSPESDVFTPHS